MKKFSYVSKKLLKDMGAGGGGDPTIPERVTALETEIGDTAFTGNTITRAIATIQATLSTVIQPVITATTQRISATPNGSEAVDISNGTEYTTTKDGYVFVENVSNADNDFFGAYIKTGNWGAGFRIGKLEGSFSLFVHAGTVVQAFHTNASASTPQTGSVKFWPLNY